MKANELMIGDLVYDTLSQTNIKVNSVCFETNPLNGICYAENLVPIPLTTEILEKNGFELEEEETGMYGVTIVPHYLCKGVPFEVFCDGEPFAIWFKEPVNIKFVHQLQHALRLCGIEKDIIL